MRLLLILLLITTGYASAAEYTTQQYSGENENTTFRTQIHFRHVIYEPVPHREGIPEVGQTLEEAIPGYVKRDISKSADYDIWMRYCDKRRLSETEYEVIDTGEIPTVLKDNCEPKGHYKKYRND
jgi:hypothetical protein